MNRGGFRAILHALAVTTVLFLLPFFIACGGSPSIPPSGLAFQSTPPTQASEGNTYAYSMQANVQGATFRLTSGPAGAMLSGNRLTWTPTAQQARTPNQFTVTATYAGTVATQSWGVTPSGTIRGTTADTCVSDTGQTATIASSVAGGTVQILVPNATSGFDTRSGPIAQDGTFSIPNISAGPFWLILPGTRLWTASSTVNLGHRLWGGCRPESPSAPGTALELQVDGLNPWQYGDYLYFAVPNARTGKGALPDIGATSVSSAIPYNNLLLLNASNGDNGYFAQLVNADHGGIGFQALQQFAGPLPITVQDGRVNSFAATLQTVPQTRTIRANISGSAFTALHERMSASAVEANPAFNFRLDISADNASPLSNGLFLVLASHPFTSDTDAGVIDYANPYPSSWTPFVDYYDMVIQYLRPPGAALPFPLVLLNRVITADLPTGSNPITPLIGPALNPEINGASLFNDQVITTTTPTLAWQAPAVGSASGFRINVYELVVTDGNPAVDLRASLYSTSTSIVLPPGVLVPGNAYCLVIASLFRKDLDVSVSPYVETFPEGESDLASGVITVQ